MIRNFVTTTTLERYFPIITSYIPTGQTDFTEQINEAFEIVRDDLRARSMDIRRVGVPLDLKYAENNTDNHDGLISSTETATTTGLHIVGMNGFNRFAVSVSALTSTGYSIALQGSNDIDVSSDTEPINWDTIATVTPTTTGETVSSFTAEYKYYRYVNTVTGSSITYTVALYETQYDRWIAYKALELICGFLTKRDDDIWTSHKKEFAAKYSACLDSYKISYDENDDNITDEEEAQAGSLQVRMTR